MYHGGRLIDMRNKKYNVLISDEYFWRVNAKTKDLKRTGGRDDNNDNLIRFPYWYHEYAMY